MSEEERKDLLDDEENEIKGDLADFSGGEEEDGQTASDSHLVLDSAATNAATSAPAPSDNEDASSMPTPTIKRKADTLSSESQKKNKKLKRAAVLGIEDEAERSDDGEESGAAGGEDDDDEDEEDEEGIDDYEYDDFVVKEASDIDSDDENPKQKKKSKKNKLSKLKKRKDNMQLEEEDLALVRENMQQPRQQELPTIDNFKMDGDEEDFGDYGGTGNRFNGYDDEDDMDDFIESSHGGGRLRPKQRDIPGRRHLALDESTFDQLREADEIFGAGYDEFLEDEEEEDLDEEKAAAAKERELERKKMLATSKGFYEYSQLVENFLLEEDEVIRSTDIPERFQLSLKGREVPSEIERQEEARWISTLLAEKILASRSKDIVDRDHLVYDIVDSVEVVLKFIQVSHSVIVAQLVLGFMKDFTNDRLGGAFGSAFHLAVPKRLSSSFDGERRSLDYCKL